VSTETGQAHCRDAEAALELDPTHSVDGQHVELWDFDNRGRITFEGYGEPPKYVGGLEGPTLLAWIRLGNAIQNWNRSEHEADHLRRATDRSIDPDASQLKRLRDYVAECRCLGMI